MTRLCRPVRSVREGHSAQRIRSGTYVPIDTPKDFVAGSASLVRATTLDPYCFGAAAFAHQQPSAGWTRALSGRHASRVESKLWRCAPRPLRAAWSIARLRSGPERLRELFPRSLPLEEGVQLLPASR